MAEGAFHYVNTDLDTDNRNVNVYLYNMDVLYHLLPSEKLVILATEPKIEEKIKAVATEPKIIILAFEDVHFDFDKSTLTPEAQTILKRNIQMLKDNPKAEVRVAGYTSASGPDTLNRRRVSCCR